MRKLLFIIIITSFPSLVLSQNIVVAVDSLINGMVDAKKLHGCVIYIQKNNKILHFKSYGYRSIEENDKMDTEDIFRIASMSKIITAAGALKLYEEGKFLLDEPVKKYLPQFKDLKAMLFNGTDSARIVNLERDVTIRDLFRHTAGFGYAYDKEYFSSNLSTNEQTSNDFLDKISKIPLKYQPGSQWYYSYSIDILGFLIERISGKSLQEYLTESLFKPLKMNSTGFFVSKGNINRLSANYLYDNEKLVLIDDPKRSVYIKQPLIYSGGGGLKDDEGGIVTSTQDFANFCNMILNYGMFNSKQILKSQTVELMISNQIAELSKDMNGFSYGFGVGVSTEKYSGKTKSIYWFGGPYNTAFYLDFSKRYMALLMTQNSPWGHLDLINKFGQIGSTLSGD